MQTVRVLRTHALFQGVDTLVIEPDRTVNYHRNYEKYGLLTGLQTPPLTASKEPPEHVSARACARYRRQIDLSEVRFASMWFTLSSHADDPGGLTRTSKKRRTASASDDADSALQK